MEKQYDHNGAEWETIEPAPRPSHIIEHESWDYHVVLLNYVYSTKLDSFIHMQTFEIIKAKHFNETYEHLDMPRGVCPESYIRNHNHETRKVYSMDMNCGTKARIYKDEQDKFILNTYVSSPIIPMADIKYKEPRWFIDHLNFILNNKEQVDHVLKWICHLIYKPEVRINHGILISGLQNSGKSFIYKVLERLIGFHNCNQVTPEDLTAKFKGDWFGKRLLCIEEIKKSGDHNYYNNLKVLFTNDHLNFEYKGKDKIRVRNNLHYIFFSNHANPITLEEGDRRFFYVHSKVTKEDLKPSEYFDHLFSIINPDKDSPELACLYKYLKDEILPTIPESFGREPAPMTADKSQAIDSGASQLVTYIKEGKDLQEHGSYFEKNKWFTVSDFIKDMPPELSNVKKSPEYVSSVLKTHGLNAVPEGRSPRVTVDGIKYTPYFWDYSARHLNLKWWSDKFNNKGVYRVKPTWDFSSNIGGSTYE